MSSRSPSSLISSDSSRSPSSPISSDSSSTPDSPRSHQASRRDPLGRFLPLCYALFFASGASGLIYEVLWTRQLIYVFGATLLAVSTVLAAFMGGLALGSFLGGRKADRTDQPLRMYALLEIGVGVAALLFPFLLKALDPLFRLMYSSLGSNLAVFSAIRFVLCFALLLIPTTMMGATLPALSRFVARSGAKLGSRLGSLYAINTAGAVLGTFAAGFILLAHLGVSRTNFVAIAINIGVGLAALALSAKVGSQSTESGAAGVSSEAGESGQDSEPALGKKLSGGATNSASPLAASPLGDSPSSASPLADSPLAASSNPARLLNAILISYFISGAVALAYQVVWTRSLVFSFEVMKNTTYAFSGMLTVFLVGLALGSALMTWRIDRERDPLRLYALLQILIGLSGAFSYFMIHFVAARWQPFDEAASDGGIRWVGAVANVMLKTGVSLGLPVLLMGMAFPAVVRVAVSLRRGVGRDVGRLYAFNTTGAILGSAGAGFVLIPLLGVTGTLALLAAVQVASGATILLMHPGLGPRVRLALAGGAAAALLVIVIRIASIGFSSPLQQVSWFEKLLYYEEGPLATVSIAEDSKGFRTIYVDNVGVAGTDCILLTDQKSLAHVPMLLTPDPKSALTVGFGSGGASFSYTTYDRLERIDCVEICSTVLNPAPLLTASNHGILVPDKILRLPAEAAPAGQRPIEGLDFRKVREYAGRQMKYQALPGYRTFDPRYHVILDDARSYLHFTKNLYDIIATDCTDLRYKSNANLYDQGYFELCRDRIREGGMVVVWMPLGGLHDAAFRCAIRTFRVVFPHVTIWYYNNEPTHYILLIGTQGPQQYNYPQMIERLKEEDVRKDLAELDLDDADKLLSCLVADEKGLDKILGDAPLNTEDFPFLEFESPKYGLGAVPLRRNLDRLYSAMTPVSEHVTGAPAGARRRMDAMQKAAPIVFRGHDRFREFQFAEAAKYYMKALEVGGEDRATRRLLNFEDIAATANALLRPRDGSEPKSEDWIAGQWLTFHLGSALALQKRWSDAVTALSPLSRIGDQLDASQYQPDLPKDQKQIYHLHGRAQALLAYCYAGAGKSEPAQQHLDRARKLYAEYKYLDGLEKAIAGNGTLPPELP